MSEPVKKIGKNVKFWYPKLSNIGKCTIGDGSTIHSHVWIADGVVIGKKCLIQAFCYFPPGIVLGDGVFVGPRVTFSNKKYPLQYAEKSERKFEETKWKME